MDEFWRDEHACYSCWVPADMVKEPHLIHFAGVLMQPGKHNDYTIEIDGPDAFLHWWDPEICGYEDKLVSITKLFTGERWAYSSKDGVYVDTRKNVPDFAKKLEGIK